MGDPIRSRLRERLLAWYRKNRRSLPWRQTRDPYRIWVSEAMLQQTQVATVIPYYEKFLKQFPTVEALSGAPVSDVLEIWAGLGYYSRAKNLHAGARTVVERFEGKVPAEENSLREIPGIGRYTAGAIASIAFDRPAPIVDGNVARVLCRYLGITRDPRLPEVQRRLWRLSAELVPGPSPGDFNQSMMELGATVCLPRGPLCARCPVAAGCVARRKNWQDRIPPPRRSAPRKKIRYLCAILRKKDSVLLARRPLTGLLPGLWEFPGGEGKNLKQLLRDRLGIPVEEVRPAAAVRQILSHRELEIRAFHCRWKGTAACGSGYSEIRWVRLQQLPGVGLTAGMAELARRLFPAGSPESPSTGG